MTWPESIIHYSQFVFRKREQCEQAGLCSLLTPNSFLFL